jgi:hypothetical protein
MQKFPAPVQLLRQLTLVDAGREQRAAVADGRVVRGGAGGAAIALDHDAAQPVFGLVRVRTDLSDLGAPPRLPLTGDLEDPVFGELIGRAGPVARIGRMTIARDDLGDRDPVLG